MAAIHTERVRQLQEQLTTQHGPVLNALRGLEAMLETMPPPAQGDLERRLNKVADTLEAHISEEESGDLFRWLPAGFEDERDELESLQAEHPDLIARLRDLAVACRSADTVDLQSELSIEIRSAVAQVRTHEAREAALVNALFEKLDSGPGEQTT